MTRVIRCEEWTRLRVGQQHQFESQSQVTALLSAWRAQTGTDPSKYFDIRPDGITPKFWSGYLAAADVKLEVLPIGGAKVDAAKRERLDANLASMLAFAAASETLEAGDADVSHQASRYDALVSMFCRDLTLARRRRVLRRYTAERGTLASPRGRVVFPAQCYEAIRRPGVFASEWLALTEDIAENRIFKEVLLQYRPRCSPTVRGLVDASLADLSSVKDGINLPLEWTRIRTDRLPAEYMALLQASKALLGGQGVGVFSGEALATSTILFTSRLFETVTAKLLIRGTRELAFSARAQAGGTFLCTRPAAGSILELIPDVQISDKNGHAVAVLDTKWKPLNHSSRTLGISGDDMYQILIYATKLDCRKAVLLYPDVSETWGEHGYVERLSAQLAGREYSIYIWKLPMLGAGLRAMEVFLKEMLTSMLCAKDTVQ